MTIDFGKMKEISYRGVRRAAAFVGLGVNAARDAQIKEYQLAKYAAIRLLPDDLNVKSIAHIKEEFEKWVILNGLREIIESFGLFLDKVHTACLLMATHKELISNEDAEKFGRGFEWKGVEGKLEILRTRFGVMSEKEKYFASINQARNCITHRKGKIGFEDLKGGKSFRLDWWGFDFYIETPSGEKLPLKTPLPKEGIYLKEGGNMMLHVTDRLLEYRLGDIITLSPSDVMEICVLVQFTTDELAKSAQAYAKKIGIPEEEIEKNVEQANPADVE